MALSSARKAALAAVMATVVGALSFGASAMAAAPSPAASGPAVHRAAAPAPGSAAAASAHRQAPRVVTQLIGKGRVDGRRWSVSLEFHRTLPKGYTLPTLPGGDTVPGDALLCQRMYIGGVRIDHQGGPWSDCQPVTGAHDSQGSGSLGLWGLQDKGTTGTRLMVSTPGPEVAYGMLHLSDGTRVRANTVTLPGTDYRGWAAPIADGQTIDAVDEYDAQGKRLRHDTFWH